MPLSSEAVRSRNITVGMIGLGYVGYPLSLTFAEAGVRVIGFDTDAKKIEMLNRGTSYIRHVDHGRLQKSLEAGRFRASSDFREIASCDAVLICVPTPLNAHLEPDLSYISTTCETIAPHLGEGSLVSLESTTWPGTCLEVVKPLLEAEKRLRVGETLHLCYSPEREDPGNAAFETKSIPKLVGADDPKSLELAVALYSLAIETVIPLSGTRTAEAAKLFENIFRSVNIALVNELKIILEKMGIDVWEVIRAAGTKPFGFMPFWPGPGLGGHCIPIDPFYLAWKAKEFGIRTRFIELAGEINRKMPGYVASKVQDCLNERGKALKGAKILILGLAYKSDIDDMRESPSLELIDLLEKKGASVDYHDPHIETIGPTRKYRHFLERRHCRMSSDYDCFLLATKHSCFSPEEILSYRVPIVDTRNFFPNHPNIFPA